MVYNKQWCVKKVENQNKNMFKDIKDPKQEEVFRFALIISVAVVLFVILSISFVVAEYL